MSDAVIWDNVWPLDPLYGNDYDKLDVFTRAGVTVLSITLAGDDHNISQTIQRIAAARSHIRAQSDKYLLVESVADVLRAKIDGKLGVALHLEGTSCFERNLDMIEAFYRLGIRHTLLAF